MFDGYMRLASNEIINTARTSVYLSRLLPTLDVRNCHDCEWLGRVTAEDTDWHNGEVFSDPASDDAPWYDPDDPDSANFYGLYPLSITGVEDDARTATVTQSLDNGGFVTGVRRSTKEILVSALLFGQDEAALSSGMSWLRVALDGSTCASCDGDDLCLFAACPKIDPDQVFDPDATQVTETIALSSLVADKGTWDGATFVPVDDTAHLIAVQPAGYSIGDEITFEWNVSQPVLMEVLSGFDVIASATGTGIVSVTVPADNYQTLSSRISSPTTTSTSVTYVRATHHPKASAYTEGANLAPQADPYRRTLREVTCVSGPTIMEEYAITHGAMLRVEFLLDAGKPWLYGEERSVASMLTSAITTDTTQPVFQQDVLAICSDVVTTAYNVTPRGSIALVRDPLCPEIPDPPRPPLIIEQCAPGQDPTVSYVVRVPEHKVPTWYDAIACIALRTGHHHVRNVRVRMFPRPLTQQLPADLDLCSACMGFEISYIPPNSTLTLDGMVQKAMLERAGNRLDNVTHLLHGIGDSGEDWPALTCGMGYYVVIDCKGTYDFAEVGVSLVVRR